MAFIRKRIVSITPRQFGPTIRIPSWATLSGPVSTARHSDRLAEAAVIVVTARMHHRGGLIDHAGDRRGGNRDNGQVNHYGIDGDAGNAHTAAAAPRTDRVHSSREVPGQRDRTT